MTKNDSVPLSLKDLHPAVTLRRRRPIPLAALVTGLLAGLWIGQVANAGDLRIELIAGYNFVVDSNVESPSSYSPRAATIGATFHNDGTTAMSNVVVHIGDYREGGGSTPGIYPSRTHSGLSGTFTLTHEGGSLGLADATRDLGTLDPGESVTVYWLVSYPLLDALGKSVAGGVKPDDDLWLQFDVWAAANAGGSAVTASESRTVHLRRMLSAMANKISPNTANKVPQAYKDLLQQYVPNWANTYTDGSPGSRIVTEGIWYDLGNVNQGFDNDGDLIPDYNVWLQPVGDPALFNAGCFRLVRTYTLLVVKRSGGQPDTVIVAENQLYFSNLPPDNTGVIGYVVYAFMPLCAGATAALSPYQTAASGRDNEKFNGDFGATLGGTFSTADTALTLDKTVDPLSAAADATLSYAIAFANAGDAAVGDPAQRLPLEIRDRIPAGTTYIAGSAAANNTLPSGVSGYTVYYSTDDGAMWTQTEPSPAASVTDLRWGLDDPLPPGADGAVTFQVTVLAPVTASLVRNTAGLAISGSPTLLTDEAVTRLTGTGSISGTVFADTGAGAGGIAGDGVRNGDEAGIAQVTVRLYHDTNGDGVLDAGDILVETLQTGETGAYLFDGLIEGFDYLVAVDAADPDLPAFFAAAAATATTPVIRVFPELSGAANTADFGFQPFTPLAIGDTVFWDVDGDGTYTPGTDAPLAGIAVTLYRDQDQDGLADGAALAVTQTDAQGQYRFDGLPPGGYLVVVDSRDPDLPAGFAAATSAHTVTLVSADVLTADFPFRPLLTKTVDKEQAAAEDLLTYTIQLSPPADAPLNRLLVEDPLPANTAFVSASHGGSLANGAVTWNLGSTTPAVQGTRTENPQLYAFRGGSTGDFWVFDVNTASWTSASGFGANVGPGGALAYTGTGGDVFGLQGNGTKTFKRFNINSGTPFTWDSRTAITSTANVLNGAALASLGGYVYAVVGNNTTEFLRYNPADNTWTSRATVPAAVANSAALATDGAHLYLLRGNNSKDFYRYDPAGNAWTALAATPSNIGKPGAAATRGGTALAHDRGNLYALEGDNGTDFLRYNIAANTWSATTSSGASLAQVPVSVTQGGAMVLRSLRFYVLTGGGNGFYRYNIDDNNWIQLPNTPAAVQWGGAIVSVGGVPARETEMRATPYAVRHGDVITVDVALSQCGFCPDTITNAVPPALTVFATGGASATLLASPSPTNIPIAATRHYTYTYQVSAGSGATPQSLRFAITNDFTTGTPATTFVSASANSVLVIPDLTLTVNVNADFDAGLVTNTAFFSGQSLDNRRACYVLTAPSCDPGGSRLLLVEEGGAVTDLGATGIDGTAALAWTTNHSHLCAADGNIFGYVDVNGNGFTPIGLIVVGDNLEGSVGPVTAAAVQVVGLAFEPLTGHLYAVHRRVGATDLLFRIDPITGRHVEDAFGAGRDYREILATAGRQDIEGIAFAPDGTLYAVAANTGTPGDGDLLVTIPSPAAASDTVQPVGVANGRTPAGMIWVDANTNATFDAGEQLYGVTSLSITPMGRAELVTGADAPGATAGSLLLIDLPSAEAEWMAAPGACGYEALACLDHTVFGVPASALTGLGNSVGYLFWIDLDGDGLPDADEPGLPGVTVRLYDATGTVLLAETVTDLLGEYRFAGLGNGTYVVGFDAATLPAGYLPTTPVSVTTDSLTGATVYQGADFGFQPAEAASGAIGDTVWRDRNADGIRLGTQESGISNITVTLFVDYEGDGSYLFFASTTTDATGYYLFDGLADGRYRVTVDTADADMPADAFGHIWLPSTPVSYGVTLSGGNAFLDADFGFAPPSAVGDTIFWDANRNGTQDDGEDGIAGVTVALYTNGVPVASIVTDANGNYLFSGLMPGAYTVLVVEDGVLANAALSAHPENDGVPVGHPDALVSNNYTTVTLVSGQSYRGADFGYVPPGGTIGGRLWVDTDNDGLSGSGENGIPFVTVTLYDNGTAVATTETDADGYYLFYGLPDGTYRVVVDAGDDDFPAGLAPSADPDGTLDHIATNVVIQSAQVVTIGGNTWTVGDLEVNFGYRYAGNNTLSGTVGLDNPASPDGRLNGTDPSGVGVGETALAGVTVFAYLWNDADTDGAVDAGETILLGSTVTAANGDYAFTGLPDGGAESFYIVSLTAPLPNLVFTTTADSGTPAFLVVKNEDAQGNTVSAYQAVPITATVENVDFAFLSSLDYDFGDLPASYGTLLPNGARHAVKASPDLYLGAGVSTETNGQPDPAAAGDTDDDGLFIDGIWQNGAGGATVRVQVGAGSGWLVGYIDFDGSGAFDTVGETVVSSAVSDVGDGWHTFTFEVPEAALSTAGTTWLYSRWRLFPAEPLFPELAYVGEASNGEVEDYRWAFSVIGGTVFADIGTVLNDFDAADSGQAGVEVGLYTNGVLAATAVTDLQGRYQFYGLPDGDYRVTLTPPSGSDAVLDRDGAFNTFTNIDVTLSGASAYARDFLIANVTTGYLGDRIWEDWNGNGIQDQGEPGITNVTVRLYDSGSNVLATAVTDALGRYVFTDLEPGSYLVRAEAPTGYVFTQPEAGEDAAFDSDGDAAGWSEPVTVAAGEARFDIDFGLVVPAVLFGYVFKDQDADSVFNTGDTAITNSEVRLFVNGVAFGTTNANEVGYYWFGDVPPGTVSVLVSRVGGTLTGVPVEGPAADDPMRNRALPDDDGLFAVITYDVVSGQGVLDERAAEPLNFGFVTQPLSAALDVSIYATATGVVIELWTTDEEGVGDVVVFALIDGRWTEVGRLKSKDLVGRGSNRYEIPAVNLEPGRSYYLRVIDEVGNVHVSSVPVPVRAIRMEALRLDRETLTLRFNTEPGRSYAVEASTDMRTWVREPASHLTAAGWSGYATAPFVAAPGGTTEIRVPVGGRPRAFFRAALADE